MNGRGGGWRERDRKLCLIVYVFRYLYLNADVADFVDFTSKFKAENNLFSVVIIHAIR